MLYEVITDYQMMEYTLSGIGPSMAILVNHDDESREYSYMHGTEKAYEDVITSYSIHYTKLYDGLVKRLLEFEVPEISQGIVEIKAIAREAGSRTKIAIFSRDENIDAVRNNFV